MKIGAQVALGVAVGYFLGRTHKMRLALTLAAAGATGRLTSNPAELVKRGTQLLVSSPEVKTLSEDVRGRLAEAVRTAAASAASKQINALTDRLHEGTESRRSPGPSDETDGEEPEGTREADRYGEEEPQEQERPRRRRPARDDEPSDADEAAEVQDEDEQEDEGEDEFEEPDRPARQPVAASGSGRRSPVRRARR